MKYSLQFSDAIHVLAYIEMFQDTRSLSSEMIASSIETNAANVRKISLSKSIQKQIQIASLVRISKKL